MKSGNEVEHLAAQARDKGRAEATWLMLRNAYFKEGTPTEGFAAMVQCFAALEVRATSEWRNVNGKDMEFIVLTPIR